MTHEAGTRPIARPVVAAEAPGLLDAALERLWHLLTSMRLALALMLALAALGVIGALVIQAPPGVLVDPDAKREWLNEIRPKFGGWTGILDQLQLFAVFTSVWFRAIGAALAISLVACSVHRVPGLLRTARNPHVDVGERFFEHAPQHETIVLRAKPAAALDQVSGVLHRRRYRTVAESDGTLHVYADRFRWAPFASLAGHLSVVVILAGAMVGSTFGFRDGEFMLAEGAVADIPTVPGAQVRLDDFRDTYYAETGAPSDYASDLVVLRNGQEVGRQTVRVNDPLRYEGITFYQSFFGPAAVISVADAKGAALGERGVPLAWREGDRSIGRFSIPEAGLVAWVIGTGGPADTVVKPGQVRVELYKDSGNAEAVAAQTIDQGTPATVGGLTLTFQRESKYTGLSLSRDPGVVLVWAGCFLLVAGFAVVFMFPHRRVWVRIVPRQGGSTVSLATVGRRDTVGAGAEFAALVDEIRTALQSAPSRT